MALKFFKQRDIDEMDASNIPDSFWGYFESLSQERKDEIISTRPDLAAALGYVVNKTDSFQVDEVSALDTNSGTKTAEEAEPEQKIKDAEEDIFSQIKINRYENEVLDQFFVDEARPLEVLTIPENTEKCIIHRCKYEKKNIKCEVSSYRCYYAAW